MPDVRRTEWRPLIILAALLALGLFLRITTLYQSAVSEPFRGDAGSYFFYAANLTDDHIFSRARPSALGRGDKPAPDAEVAPGYPLFVAALLGKQWHDGSKAGAFASVRPALIAQTWLSGLLVVLVYIAARRHFPAGTALAAAGLAAISPHLVNANIYLLTESFFTLIFWSGMLLLLLHLEPDSHTGGLLAGATVLALAALTRPTVQYLPVLLACMMILRDPAHWRRWAAFLAVFVAIMTAWGLRNLASIGVFSDPLLLRNTLQHGSYPDFMFGGIAESLGQPYRYDPLLSQQHSVSGTLSVIIARALQAPGEYLHWYLIGKPLAFFTWHIVPIGTSDNLLYVGGDIYLFPTPETPYANSLPHKLTYVLSYALYRPLLLTAVASAVAAWLPSARTLFGAARPVMQVLSLTLAYVVGIHMVGAPFPRYAIPFQPLLWLLALGLLSACWASVRAKRAIEPTTDPV